MLTLPSGRNRYLLLGMLATIVGCSGGGSLSQADMKREAMRIAELRKSATSGRTAAPRKPESTRTAARTTRQPAPVLQKREVKEIAPTNETPSKEIASVQISRNIRESRLAPLPQSVENLTRIGKAFGKRIGEKRGFPPASINGLLSWRVELLPYLGYDDLYNRFHLDEPWDSPHNKSLLGKIPVEFRSPERQDERTNYLVPQGSGTIFWGPRGTSLRKIEDGIANTVLVIEVDDEQAVPWTKPGDYLVREGGGIGGLRNGKFLVVWANGVVGAIDRDVAPKCRNAMFSIDGGEAFRASEVHRSIDTMDNVITPEETGKTEADVQIASQEATSPVSSAEVEKGVAEVLAPVPCAEQRAPAITKARALYSQPIAAAKTGVAKQRLARQMFSDAQKFSSGSVEQFVLMDACRQFAEGMGDSRLAITVVQQMGKSFEIDTFRQRTRIVRTMVNSNVTKGSIQCLYQEALHLIQEAVANDDYQTAQDMLRFATIAARRGRIGSAARQLSGLQQRLIAAKTSFKVVEPYLPPEGGTVSDPHECFLVGRYECFIKGEWERGLPRLARCDDAALRDLAERDLATPIDAETQLELGDDWWNYSNGLTSHKRLIARYRAANWYMKAMPRLGPCLERTTAAARIEQLRGS